MKLKNVASSFRSCLTIW